ncbi:MAG TPA: energy transducer TonB, partial [Chitinophagaceae bacterium]|nr:energy transducer TonB [Chitinophagaceae bacterium]
EKFKPNLLKKQSQENSANDINNLTARHDNQDSRVEDWGAFTLNTYDWEFAPYMLQVRRTVNGNVYPPPAFLRMGIIDGKTLISFKIYPNGEVRELKVVKYVGHRTLMETSYKAIEVSAPFPPLPSDFPLPYLEIHYSFHYQTVRSR